MFERFTGQAYRVVDLGRAEAEGLGHRYLGPEHLLLAILRESEGPAAAILRAHGVDLAAARAGLLGLADQGAVPAPRPSEAALLGTLGIDLDQVRRTTERTFGATAVGEATWRVTRRGFWRGGRVVWTPLCGPPLLAKRALQLASEHARARGHPAVRPEHLLLGILEDARQPPDRTRTPRRHRRILAHVGLHKAYQGAAGPLLEALRVDLEALRAAVQAELAGGVQR